MSDLSKVLYTAEATAEGGRDGRTATNDGRLEVDLDLTGSRVTARVGLGTTDTGGFGLTAAIDLDAPGLEQLESAAG